MVEKLRDLIANHCVSQRYKIFTNIPRNFLINYRIENFVLDIICNLRVNKSCLVPKSKIFLLSKVIELILGTVLNVIACVFYVNTQYTVGISIEPRNREKSLN